jgi:hypothetical protein
LIIWSGAPLAAGHDAIKEQQNYCADDTGEEASALSGSVPSHSLAKVRCDERADNSQNSSQNKARWFSFIAGHDEFGNHSNNETYDDSPNDTHFTAPAHEK